MKISFYSPPILLLGLFSSMLLLQSTQASNSVITSIKNDLLFDENGKLTSHQLLYPAGHSDCPAANVQAGYGFESHEVDGEAFLELFGTTASSISPDCRAVCVEKGVDQSVAHAAMPHRHFTPGESGDFQHWFDETCRKVEVCFLNYHSQDVPLQLWWVHPETGDAKFHVDITYGERHTRCFSSFVGHEFQARDPHTGAILETLPIEFSTVKAFGQAPVSSQRKPGHSFQAEIERTLRHEWTRHNNVGRTFSELGFKKGRLPDDVFASMGALYYNNRHHAVREEWGGKGVFVNWWETDVTFIQIPWAIKQLWQERLKQLVEAWAGVPVEQTDMYGLRQYQEGARLLTHVDRQSTHAVSLIVNIAQGNLTEPWSVEVNDHADRLHEVVMNPGDIVYYESAKALHGRNRPMKGPKAYYVNLFTHYRPLNDPDWYKKPNHEGTPEAVVEVEGDCRLEAAGTTAMPNDRLGIVQAVHCDDPRLGPYVSPTLFQATSGDDLIEWWKATSPPDAILTVEPGSEHAKDEL